MYIENTEGFEGDLLSKFGVEVRDCFKFLSCLNILKIHIIRPKPATSTRPAGNQVFEIRFVEHENPFLPVR